MKALQHLDYVESDKTPGVQVYKNGLYQTKIRIKNQVEYQKFIQTIAQSFSIRPDSFAILSLTRTD